MEILVPNRFMKKHGYQYLTPSFGENQMIFKLTLFSPGFFYRFKGQDGVFRDPLKSQEPLKLAEWNFVYL